IGGQQLFGGHQVGDERALSRVEEGGGGGHGESEYADGEQAGGHDSRDHQQSNTGADNVGKEHRATAVPAVHEDAREQAEDQARQGERDHEGRDRQRGLLNVGGEAAYHHRQ